MRFSIYIRLLFLLCITPGLMGAVQVQAYHWQKPDWVPVPVVPNDNPMTADKVELGRQLFYDLRLSANNKMACASCHIQEKGFTDGKALSLGVNDELGVRNAMSLVNLVYLPVLTWANPNQKQLEAQLLVPLFGTDPIELGLEGQEALLFQRLQADAHYPALFKKTFPTEKVAISMSTISKAIASFERSLLSFNSPYDQYKYGGKPQAISAAAKQGEDLFFGDELECSHCHGGFNFTDSVQHKRLAYPEIGFHNTGLYNLDGKGAYPADNAGIRAITSDVADEGKFRSPTLRNIAVTGPYMHDGSISSLRDVIVKHYAVKGRAVSDGQAPSPLRDPLIDGFKITDAEVDDLLAFLESLTDQSFLTNPRHADPAKYD